MLQKEHTKINEIAWNGLVYEAWLNRFGTPEQYAEKIKLNPQARLGSMEPFLKDVKGKKIANLLGSNGIKSVALACLGGDVTVIDFSEENRRYAKELAAKSKVKINYIVSDVLALNESVFTEDYDIVFCELGILHYFIDLKPFFMVAHKLLKKDGSFIIQDFHPISTKLITTKGKKHKITGDYFNKELHDSEVAYLKYIPGIDNFTKEERDYLGKTKLRKWTIGEVITATAEVGFTIKALKESEGVKPEDKGIPKLFTLICKK